MSDEGFHEIQLNGKQLVFLFMAATVVAVVVFLCGVMVGRGVPQRAAPISDVPQYTLTDPTAGAQPEPAAAVASTGIGPVTTDETLTYVDRLSDPTPPRETLAPPPAPAPPPKPEPMPVPVAVAPPKPAPPQALKPAAVPMPNPAAQVQKPAVAPAPKPANQPPAVVAPVPAPMPMTALAPRPAAVPAPQLASAAPPAAAAPRSEPTGSGFVVQVAAVRQRAEADRIAQRLSAKGYPAFVTAAGANFRVRVGKYDDRGEAEAVAGRLTREEQFKPWITR